MAARILNIKEQLEVSLHDNNKPWTTFFDQIEGKTGVNRLYIFIGTVAFIGLWLCFGFAGQLLCNGIGFLYPAYVSIHAIESPAKDDDTKWLTYWVIFAIFSLCEYFADVILSWFPMYWLIKCIFMVWLMMPTECNGSIILYTKIIKPYFLKYHSSVDGAINKAREHASKLLEKEQ